MNQGLKPDLYIVLARTADPSGERGVPCQKAASISVVVITHSYMFNQKQIHVESTKPFLVEVSSGCGKWHERFCRLIFSQ